MIHVGNGITPGKCLQRIRDFIRDRYESDFFGRMKIEWFFRDFYEGILNGIMMGYTVIPSGQRLHHYGKIHHLSMGKLMNFRLGHCQYQTVKLPEGIWDCHGIYWKYLGQSTINHHLLGNLLLGFVESMFAYFSLTGRYEKMPLQWGPPQGRYVCWFKTHLTMVK